MGNYVSNQLFEESGKVVLPNGTIHSFDHPLTVAELMLEHPQQLVVEFNSEMNGNKLTPLPADKKLDMKKVYLMIPKKTGRSGVLSVEEARKVFQNANSVLKSKALLSTAEGLLPLFIKGCKMGGVKVENNTVLVEKRDNQVELSLESLEERTEIFSRQFSSKGWKPSLDTIKEKKLEKKVSHWLF
ncbi:hypothetical protein ACHQM5_026316 [Ranunculus cassubicifolius]